MTDTRLSMGCYARARLYHILWFLKCPETRASSPANLRSLSLIFFLTVEWNCSTINDFGPPSLLIDIAWS